MLNRKISNYLFYFVLISITIVIILIRIVTIGNLDEKIDALEANNLFLQAQIASIEEIVEDNNDVQINHLYELYNQVPNALSITELTYYTTAQLELSGITEEADMQRSVLVNQEITFADSTLFSDFQEKFDIVEVKVFFTTQDESDIAVFIDLLYNSDQIFIVHYLNYSVDDGTDFITVTIDFLSFYEKEETQAN